jgi:hemolysin activation/secretion protein
MPLCHTLIKNILKSSLAKSFITYSLNIAAIASTLGQLSAQDISFYIRQYKVEGAKKLTRLEIEEAVYPFLGPGRTPDDVEKARQALEKAHHDKGFQTVSVSIPQQDPRRGTIRLEVSKGAVARLRVNGSRWFLPSEIKKDMPSVAEGTIPDLKQFTKEIIAINRLADRRVTPELRPGAEPGTVDIDLNVEDKFPLHGSIELNNRYSADTTELRLNGSLTYANLFQKGHIIGGNFQVAPENPDDALIYSAFYMARVAEKTSLMLTGTKQNSTINTIGGATVGAPGEIVGLRAMFDLPTKDKFFQTANIGIDYKNLEEDIMIGKDTISSPIEYYPLSAGYSASWNYEKHYTEFNASVSMQLRGMGSDAVEYANKRYSSRGNFITLRTDASHTHDLPGGAQVFTKIQGQTANQALISSEQFAGGGLGTVRGYLEATNTGDNAIFGSLELRSPSIIGKSTVSVSQPNEWRIYAFADAGMTHLIDALPGQDARPHLYSVGLGSRIKVKDHYHASIDAGVPLSEQTKAEDNDVRITFRGWADF